MMLPAAPQCVPSTHTFTSWATTIINAPARQQPLRPTLLQQTILEINTLPPTLLLLQLRRHLEEPNTWTKRHISWYGSPTGEC